MKLYICNKREIYGDFDKTALCRYRRFLDRKG